MFKRIAVALDGSICAAQALDVAIDLARQNGALLGICSVVEPLATGATLPSPSSAAIERGMRAAAHEIVEQALHRAQAFGISAVGETRYGSPVREITKYAETFNASAILIGTHGRRGFSRLLAGSVAEGVLEKSLVPVIMVREKREPHYRTHQHIGVSA